MERSKSGGAIDCCFVYGTLLVDEILVRLLRRVPQKSTARLHGYSRFGIKGQVYPAIRAEVDGIVEGAVITCTPEEMKILDDYEGDQYVRTSVACKVDGKAGATEIRVVYNITAYTYVAGPGSDMESLLEGAWSLEAFERDHLEAYKALLPPLPDEDLESEGETE